MKKIIKTIIALTVIISSLSTTFAEEGYIEKLLDLNYGIEKAELDLYNIDYITFKQDKYNRIYNELKTVDTILKKAFIEKYRNLEYTYYQTSGIVKNYNNYIYHTNKFFMFIKMKEYNNNYKELDSAILKSYRDMKYSYSKVKNIIKRDY